MQAAPISYVARPKQNSQIQSFHVSSQFKPHKCGVGSCFSKTDLLISRNDYIWSFSGFLGMLLSPSLFHPHSLLSLSALSDSCSLISVCLCLSLCLFECVSLSSLSLFCHCSLHRPRYRNTTLSLWQTHTFHLEMKGKESGPKHRYCPVRMLSS